MQQSFRVRTANASDLVFLHRMLMLAARWREQEPDLTSDVIADDHMRRYVEDWGRQGDVSVIADDAASVAVGAAWMRVFSRKRPGFGFVDESTPELSIAVASEWRRRGIGTALLTALIEAARRDGYAALSLSVEADNPALSLYERLGFTKRELLSSSWTMRLDLSNLT